MTLNDIQDALRSAIRDGRLDLYGANADPRWPLATLVNAANKFGPSPSVSPLGDIAMRQTASAVILTATATLTAPGTGTGPDSPHGVAVTATLTTTLPTPDAPLFRLALTGPTTGWTFAASFSNLPDAHLVQGAGLTWQDSFMGRLTVQNPVFTADSATDDAAKAVTFSGRLPLAGNGDLDTLTGWIGVQPLSVQGSIVMPQSATASPAIDLTARIPNARLRIGKLEVRDVGLWLQSQIDLDRDILGVTEQTLLSLYANLTLGSPAGVTATLACPLLQGDFVWPLHIGFGDDKPTLSGGLGMLADLFDGLTPADFPLPDGLPVLDDFTINEISAGLVPPSAAHPMGGLNFVAVTLGSDKQWVPPVPFVRLLNVGTRWIVTFGGDPYAFSLNQAVISGCVWGDVVIGGPAAKSLPRHAGLRPTPPLPLAAASGDAFTIEVNALLPSFVFSGRLKNDDTIPLGSALEYFFGGSGPSSAFSDVAITAFAFSADPRTQVYDAQATVTTDVAIPLGQAAITLSSVNFWVDVTQGNVSGGLSGLFVLVGGAPNGEEDPLFVLAADYSHATDTSGWEFSGQLYPGRRVDLTRLAGRFLSATVPAWVPQITIDQLAFRFNTTAKDYRLAGSASAKWPAPILGIAGGIAITAFADISRADNAAPTGVLGGSFQIGKIEVSLETDLGATEQIYRFIAKFDTMILTLTTGQRTSPGAKTPHQVLYARLGGVTLGEILEYLVNLAAPTLGYSLDSPWDLLNRIDLSRFQLMFDPTDNIVELTCDIGADITVMRIDAIGVRYWKPHGKSTVELIVEGQFLGKDYTGDNSLAWDVVNDPPPAVPGQGTSLIDIRYLGLGQRIAFADDTFNSLGTVRAFLDALARQMGEVADPDSNPLTQNPGMVFAADSQWCIGLDLTLMDTVDLGFLFNDPKLYGLSISLHGEKAKSFSGLDFEILYKKISDNVGLFRIELRLPEQFRHFEMGEVSVTLGVVVVEIYTNGNFKIDLGFPANRDFERSFSVEMFPFLGRGGLYFGWLDGTTSSRTPSIDNGSFAPVIEAGLGLAVGVGKDVRFGPLRGGAYVQVEAIFQGVLAWFNPSDAGLASDTYYWMQATVAMHGRIYGEVDFVIVKASANVEAYAEAAVILEAYRAALFRLAAWIRVSAKVRVLFVSIHFSFSAEIDLSFTVGSDSQTPWRLATGQSDAALPDGRRRPHLRKRALAHQHLLAASARQASPQARLAARDAVLAGEPDYVLDWNAQTPVFPSVRDVPLCLVVAGSVAGLPAAWSAAQAPPLPASVDYRLAFVATAADGRDSAPRDALRSCSPGFRTAARSAHAANPANLPVDTLMEALLRWSIKAVAGEDATTITSGQLAVLSEQITWKQTTDAFSLPSLSEFFSHNIVLRIAGPPTDGTTPGGHSASVTPMPPFLNWTSTTLAQRDFAAFNRVGPLYEWGANDYFTQFQTTGGDPGDKPEADDPESYESMASYVFRDWCLMLARTAVQAASEAMAAAAFAVSSPMSLADIARKMPTATLPYAVRAGDALADVAADLGVTTAELTFHNPDLKAALANAAPGATLPITLGVAPTEIAGDNPDAALATGVSLELGDIAYQLDANDILAGIADRFGLAGAQDLFADPTLAGNTTILRPDATFPIPSASYANPQGFALRFVAAIFFIRLSGRIDIEGADRLGEAVFQLNAGPGQPLESWTDSMDLPRTSALAMPPQYAGLAPTNTYTPLSGDTLLRLGAALALASGQDADAAGWPDYLQAVTETNPKWAAGPVTLPALPLSASLEGVTVSLGESVAILASRTIVFADNPVGILAWIADQPILAPLAMLTVSGVRATTQATPPDTFATLATRFGLSIDDLASRQGVATSADLLPGDGSLTLTIRHLPAQTVEALVTTVMTGPAPAQAAGLTARQLLSGQSLPAPQPDAGGHMEATGDLTPLYDLTGQQLPGPRPDTTQPDAVAFAVSVGVNAGCDWVKLVTSSTVRQGETLEQVRTRIPDVDSLNPALALPGRFAPGLLLHTGATPSLTIQRTNRQLADLYPRSGLLLSPTRGPQAMPMVVPSARPYGLDHHIAVQSPVGFAFTPDAPAPLAGRWSLWPFPEALLARAQAATSAPYELVRRDTDASRPQTDELIGNATWAGRIGFQIRRIPGHQDIFELPGADTADRQLLLAAWRRLAATPGCQGYLLYAPTPSNDDTSGILAAQTDPEGTFIVKTNLGTQTSSGVRAEEVPSGGSSEYYASFGDLANFCTLLWEASVVGGAGYTFSFHDTVGNSLPDGAFNEAGLATISLLLLDATQLAPTKEGRPLLPTNNCALVAPGLNASTTALCVLCADDSDTIDTPAFPPGNIGFTATLPQAEVASNAGGAELLAAQFSLLAYAVAPRDQSPFTPTSPAPPMNPHEEDGKHHPPALRRRLDRRIRAGLPAEEAGDEAAFWRYDQVLPIARFGPASASPDVPGLPSPKKDPYRGPGAAGKRAPARVRLDAVDVFGNTTTPADGGANVGGNGSPPPGAVDFAIGYNDPLIGPSNWPGTTLSYGLDQKDGALQLSVNVASQPAVLAPTPQQSAESLAATASLHAARYRDAYYQLVQNGVTPRILTTLHTDKGEPVPLNVDKPHLALRHVTASYLRAQAAAEAKAVGVDATLAPRLGDVTTVYGTGPFSLGSACGDTLIMKALGPASLTVPVCVPFAEGDTAQSLVDAAKARGRGWPAPADGAALLLSQANAAVLPLRGQSVLALPAGSTFAVPQGEVRLDQLAKAMHTTQALLAADIAAQTENPPRFAEGFVFEYAGCFVTTSAAIATFAQVVAAFAARGTPCSVADLAVENATKPGLFTPDTVLPTGHLVVGVDETLAEAAGTVFDLPLTPHLTLAGLAQANARTSNLFDSGASVSLGSLTLTLESEDSRSISAFAASYGTQPGHLLAANAEVALPADTALTVPGAVAAPSDTTLTPFVCRSGDTLNALAPLFATTPADLARANAAMPQVIAGGIQVTIKGATVTTQASWSIDALNGAAKAIDPSIAFSDTVAAIAGDSRALATDALLACPPAAIPHGDNLTVKAAAGLYHLDAMAFAQANAGTMGLIAAKVSLTAPGLAAPVTTGPAETFNAILTRFAQAGAPLSLGDILKANPDVALIASGAKALLPAPPSTLTATLAPQAGPFPGPIFPLRVRLRLERPTEAVSEDADPNGPVARVDAVIPAPTAPDTRQGDASQTFDAFARSFVEALPLLRLATAKVEGQSSDLWAVDFGPSGIASVAVRPAVAWQETLLPRVWALRPLYDTLQTRTDVAVRTVTPDGELSAPTLVNIHDLDPETWATRFLHDMEIFLSAPYAAALYADTTARGQLKTVLDAKKTLARAIAQGLAPVLDIAMPTPAPAAAQAMATLEESLSVNLECAYAVAALLQYDAQSTSAFTDPPARLCGAANPAAAQAGAPREALPPFTLTGAKTELASPSSYVSFLMTVPDVAASSQVPVNLDYRFDEIEWNITPVENVKGYVGSDWASFMPSLSTNAPAALSTNLGASTIPVPLRAYPPLPVLGGQSSAPSQDKATSLDTARLWTFGLYYAHQHAAQDTVILGVDFNLESDTRMKSEAAQTDIVSALAAYATAADDLWALLPGWLNTSSRAARATTLQNAAGSFAQLAATVATAWQARWPLAETTQDGRQAEQASPYLYHVRVNYQNGDLDTLTLTSLGSGGVSPSGDWPNAWYTPPGASPLPMPRLTTDDNTDSATYQFPRTPDDKGLYPAGATQTLAFAWSNLDVAKLQNARGNLSARRNAKLLGENGPDTNADFVYQTPRVHAESGIWPLLVRPEPFNIGSGPQAGFASALQAALVQALGEPKGQDITLAADYGCELKAPSPNDPEGLVTYLPVKLCPHTTFTTNAAANLADSLATWLQDNPPASRGGQWVVSLSLYANASSTDPKAAPGRVLLRIEKMVYRLTKTQ